MKTMILLFVVAFSLLVSPTSRAQTCIDSYWELEDLGELQGDRSPVPHLPFTDPWVVRCGIGTVNGINSHGDVVSTHDTPSGPVAAVNDGSLPVAASGPSIACAISDDRWVSGSHDGNAALWYLAGSSYSLYPFSLLPSGALPNASLHIGAMPTVQWIRQPGNVLEMLSGGVYRATREGVGTLASGPVMGRDMLYLPVVDDDGMKHLPLHRMEFAEGAPCTEWY